MIKPRIFGLPLLLVLPLLAGCATSDPTTAVLLNQYPVATDASTSVATTVYQAWWDVALFAAPIPAGQISDPVRVVQGTDYAYALLAPGWDSTSGTPPSRLIPIRSSHELTATRGDTLNIVISDATTVGNCAAGEPLSQTDADFITQRIFPGPFSDLRYDPASCTSSPAPADAGESMDAEGGEAGAATALASAGAGGQSGDER
jgi:hypothetical protein